MFVARSDESPRTARKVTWTGQRRSWNSRRTCGTPGRSPVGFRPAPGRRPPRRWSDSVACWMRPVTV